MANFIIFIILLVLGYAAGRLAERRHYRSIHKREEGFFRIPTTNVKTVDDGRECADARLVIGNVVISVDYYKRFLMTFRNILGGEVRSYAPLLDRGRREAILRMKEAYPDADAYLNCRIETSSISKGKKKAVGSVEVIATATAVKYRT